MKRTMPTLAVLMAATLFTAAAAHAQNANSDKAYPPGPSGQAAAQTQNVNVVNAPTVQVGNEVAVKTPAHTPLFVQKFFTIGLGATYTAGGKIDAPAGTRMVIENVNMGCTSSTPQGVAAYVFKPGISYAVVTMVPPPVAWDTSSFSALNDRVELLVDDSITVSVQRATTGGYTDCAVTVTGYTTPLP